MTFDSSKEVEVVSTFEAMVRDTQPSYRIMHIARIAAPAHHLAFITICCVAAVDMCSFVLHACAAGSARGLTARHLRVRL